MLKKNKNQNKEWRCLFCGRLLGIEKEDGFLEIESRNKQKISFNGNGIKKAQCKCGVITTISGNLTMFEWT